MTDDERFVHYTRKLPHVTTADVEAAVRQWGFTRQCGRTLTSALQAMWAMREQAASMRRVPDTLAQERTRHTVLAALSLVEGP